MPRHPFHNDVMPCPLADSYLGVIGDMEEARDQMTRHIELLKVLVRREATEHLNWRAVLAAAPAPREGAAAPTTEEADDGGLC